MLAGVRFLLVWSRSVAVIIFVAVLSACSIYMSPHGKHGGIVIHAPSKTPEIKPMPDPQQAP